MQHNEVCVNNVHLGIQQVLLEFLHKSLRILHRENLLYK
jgi:hypothetical protein